MAEKRSIPVSLGKPSLRLRLEEYYRLIAPDQIQAEDWRKRFDQIYEKYGGTIKGEEKLARNLAKKYGTQILLQTVEPENERADETPSIPNQQKDQQQNREEWYQLNEKERNSGVVDLCSDCFDPVAALYSSETVSVNPFVEESPLFDRVEQCRPLLPISDPLYRDLTAKPPKEKKEDSKPIAKSTAFASIAKHLAEGPFKLLHEAFTRRQRVRIVIRYVNGIRGTMTGQIIAYDKHCNIILKDAEEVYTPRTVDCDDKSNREIEYERRRIALHEDKTSSSWGIRRRQLGQLLVRGDMVVMVYIAKEERSAWPITTKSPKESLYAVSKGDSEISKDMRVGTPGSLGFASTRTHR